MHGIEMDVLSGVQIDKKLLDAVVLSARQAHEELIADANASEDQEQDIDDQHG